MTSRACSTASEGAEVGSRRGLEDFEAEGGEDGDEMLDDRCGFFFEGDEGGVLEIEPEFQGEAVGCGVELSDEGPLGGFDFREMLEAMVDIGTEQGEIGRAANGGFMFRKDREEAFLTQAFDEGAVCETDAEHVDMDGALHASGALVDHAVPVLEGVADEGVGGNGRYGVVEIAHFDGREGDFLNGAVDVELVDGHPVSDAEHFVEGELDAGDQAEDGVLEDEHEDRGHGSESCRDAQGIIAQELGNKDDAAEAEGEETEELEDAHEMVLAELLHEGGGEVLEEGSDEEGDAEGDVGLRQAGDDDEGGGIIGIEASGKEMIDDETGDEMAYGLKHGGVDEIVVPFGLGVADDFLDQGGNKLSEKVSHEEGAEEEDGDDNDLGHGFTPTGLEADVAEKDFHILAIEGKIEGHGGEDEKFVDLEYAKIRISIH